jgi:metal-dependent amidase/aminoacylase/carboxypeptidase family protein
MKTIQENNMNDKELTAQFIHTSTEALEEEYETCKTHIQKLQSFGVEWVHESSAVKRLETTARLMYRELSRRAQGVR